MTAPERYQWRTESRFEAARRRITDLVGRAPESGIAPVDDLAATGVAWIAERRSPACLSAGPQLGTPASAGALAAVVVIPIGAVRPSWSPHRPPSELADT
jgi:hypothetical protein